MEKPKYDVSEVVYATTPDDNSVKEPLGLYRKLEKLLQNKPDVLEESDLEAQEADRSEDKLEVEAEGPLEGGSRLQATYPPQTASSASPAASHHSVGHLLHLLLINRHFVHAFVALLFTAWWISIIAQPDHRHQWLIPTCLWGIIMIRLITWNSTIGSSIFHVLRTTWSFLVSIRNRVIPERFRLLSGIITTLAVILLGTLVPAETADYKRKDRIIPFFGILIAIFLFWLTSKHRSSVNWFTVTSAMLMQFIVALFVLRTGAGYDFFNFISTLARDLLGFAKDGVAFLTSTQVSQYGMFFFSVLPAIIFFVAVVHIWYQWGLVQWVVSKGSYFFIWTTRTSGCESAAATAAPFIGQGENAILVARLLPYATSSELHAIMTSGFATIAGSVLASYIALGLNPQAMVSSCIMSIPCSLAMSKLRYPEVELSQTNGRVLKPKDLNKDAKVYTNWLEAFIEGATLGLTVAGMVLTSTMCVVSLVAFINAILTWFGDFWNIDNLSLTMIFGYILYPVAFFLGTPSEDIMNVARLIATKLTFNEYVGYTDLTTMKPYTEMDERSKFIATYCLCGFANFGSVGVNIGVLKTLAPRKSKQVASLVISALITGACSTIISAGIASMVVNDVGRFSTGK